MSEIVVRRIQSRSFHFGGETHTGWLPAGAALPQPTPEVELELDLSILTAGAGYRLEWHPTNPVVTPELPFSGDLWHQSLEDALLQAETWFGISAAEWDVVGPV